MKQAVPMGATLQCSFGGAPSTFVVTPEKRVFRRTPVGTIMDNIPLKNIQPFGLCASPANPAVVTATAAAFGVPTPAPCVPMTIAPWVPGSVTILTGGEPTLNTTCKLTCSWGGCISVINPGQLPMQVK